MNYLAFHKEMTMGKFHHAYLFSFSGKKEDYDDYLAEMGIKALVDHLISQDSRQFNYVVYYGHDAESLTETLFTPPMFGDKRVTVVKQAHKLTGTPLDAVERYVKKPPSDGHLVLQAGDVDKRK